MRRHDFAAWHLPERPRDRGDCRRRMSWSSASDARPARSQIRPAGAGTSSPGFHLVSFQPGRGAQPRGGRRLDQLGGPITLDELRARSSCSTSGPTAASTATTSCPTWPSSRRSTRTSWSSSASTPPSSSPSATPRTSAARSASTGSSTRSSTTPTRSIWNRFGVKSWPTLVLIDPDGQYVGSVSGEGHYDVLDRAIGKLVASTRPRASSNLTPLEFFPENEKPDDGPLLFPGKVLADAAGKRLFIADTGHNRIVQTDLDGKNPVAIGNGERRASTTATTTRPRFNRPQGMCLVGETLYVADTENHAIRAVDLKAKTVTTIAGTGKQSPRVRRPLLGPGARRPR